MAQYGILLKSVLEMKLRAKQYGEIWDMMMKDCDVYGALMDIAQTQEEIIDLLDYKGPVEPDEVLEGDIEYACEGFLPLAYAKGWYKVCGYIYSIGYCVFDDPLCGDHDPLVFAAMDHNPAFAQAYIEGQKQAGNLTFDGERRCDDGVYRTYLEELVALDDVDVVRLCMENGANPNAFGIRGDRLLDVAKSQQMQALLRENGALNATQQERNLVRLVNELRNDCANRNTIDAYFATEPLLKISWSNGTGEDCVEQNMDVVCEAARACHAELLEKLYLRVEKDMDDSCRRQILTATLGADQFWIFGDITDKRPAAISETLEVLFDAGFRCTSDDGFIVKILEDACIVLRFGFCTMPAELQVRMFTALWQICGSPKDAATVQAIDALAQKHEKTELSAFAATLK